MCTRVRVDPLWEVGYEAPAFSPSSLLPLLLSHSSYFWPSGMVAPPRDSDSRSCYSLTRALVRSAPSKWAPSRRVRLMRAPLSKRPSASLR
jgi:hypothetical protein